MNESTDAQPAPGPTLHSLFEARARARPHALAAAEGPRRLDYAQLDRDANRVALALLARGVRLEERVGVLAERSLEYLVGILGVLKAGAAYLPLDPHQPDERIRYMKEDGGARVVLAQRRFADRVGGGIVPIEVSGPAAAPEAPSPALGRGESLAYVIYTSGSTGRPKGVMVEHRSVVSLVELYQDFFAISEEDRFTQIQRPGFDGCVAEIWPALCLGREPPRSRREDRRAADPPHAVAGPTSASRSATSPPCWRKRSSTRSPRLPCACAR